MGRWLRISTDFYRNPQLWQLPDDAARFAWLAVLGAAKVSATPGRFSGLAHFQASVPAVAASNFDAYVQVGLLRVEASGSVAVADWAGQNDPTAGERQARRREAVAEYAPVLPPVEPEPSDQDDAFARVALVAEELTSRPYVLADPHSKIGDRASDLIARHGEKKVIETFRLVAKTVGGRPTISQLVFGASNALDPVPTIKPVAPAVPEPKRRCRSCQGAGMVPLDLLPDGSWEPAYPGYPSGMKPCECEERRTA